MSTFTVKMLTGVFVLGLSSMSYAGMLEEVAEKTDQANKAAQEAVQTKENTKQQVIEAQNATKTGTDRLVQDAKEEAKSAVNESIDNLGK